MHNIVNFFSDVISNFEHLFWDSVHAASEYLSKVVSISTLLLRKTIGIIVLHTCDKCQVWKTSTYVNTSMYKDKQ